MSDPRRPDRQGTDVPGDTGAPDIVGPTGEEMPVAGHDEVDAPRPAPGPARPPGKAVPTKSSDLPQ